MAIEVIAGETIRLEASFYNFGKALADPTSVTFKAYTYSDRTVLITANATKDSVGVYYYYYTVADDSYGSIVCEFTGMLDGSPTVVRELLLVKWV